MLKPLNEINGKQNKKIVGERETVIFQHIKYFWSKGGWYYAESNIKVPICEAMELNKNFLTVKTLSYSKRPKIGWNTKKRFGIPYQAGIPGLGKKR